MRIPRIVAAAGAAVALALPAAASAAVTPRAVTAGIVTDSGGEAGYYVHAAGYRFGGMHWQVNLGAQAAAVLGTSVLPGTVTGAMGGQLCDPATGDAVQFGAVYAGAGEWEFAYAAGVLAGNPSNGDPCVGGLLQGVTPVIAAYGTGVPVREPAGAQVRLSIQTRISPHAAGGLPGRVATFTVTDMTTGLTDWTSPPLDLSYAAGGVWPQFHEAGIGVQAVNPAQALTILTPAAQFTYVRVSDYAGQVRWLDGRWASTEVVATTDGTAAGTVLVSPLGSESGGHFTISSAAPVVTGS